MSWSNPNCCSPSSHTWISSYAGSGLPPNAVYAGNDSDGSPIYVGRAYHETGNLPAKVIPSKQVGYVSNNGQEIAKYQYEVLSGNGFTWVPSSSGNVPPGAVIAGNTSMGEPLYVGRTHYQGSLTPGKVHKTHGCLYFPYGGSENRSVHYEVLVEPQQRSQWSPSSAHAPSPYGAIRSGHDTDGTPMFVGRASHEGDQIPAKVLPNKKIAYICYNGQEIPKHNFEVLCNGNVQWVHSGHGHVPPNAIPGGRTKNGEILYIGRVSHAGSLTVGKVHPSHGSLYIAYGGREMSFKDYEILIEN